MELASAPLFQVAADIFCPHRLYLRGKNIKCSLWLLFQSTLRGGDVS